MTRYNISLTEGVEMVLHALENAWGGELFVPKIPSYKIIDVAEAIVPGCKIEIVGIRPGEKVHEEMISSSDPFNTYDLGNYYVILPQMREWSLDEYIEHFNAIKVQPGFCFNSGSNEEWLTVEQIRELIKKYIDPNFETRSIYETNTIR